RNPAAPPLGLATLLASYEKTDQDEPGDEPADVRKECHASCRVRTRAERAQPGEEVEAEEHESGDTGRELYEDAEDQPEDWNGVDEGDGRGWIDNNIAGHHRGDGARSTHHGYLRKRVGPHL